VTALQQQTTPTGRGKSGGRPGATVTGIALLTTLLTAEATALGGAGVLVSQAVLEASLRVTGVVAACGAVGSLVLAALVLSRSGGGIEAARVRLLLRSASSWSVVWGVAACCAVVLTLVQGRPEGALGVHAGDEDPAAAAALAVRAGVLTAWAAGMVFVLSRGPTRPRTVLVCLALAYAGIVPAAFTGHSGHADARQLAVLSIAVHIVAATTWVGGLLALVIHAVNGGPSVPVVRAFSALALVCFVAVAASGAVNLASRVPLDDLPSTGAYGYLVVAKLCGLVLLGALGAVQRRRCLGRLEAGRGSAFWTVVAGELVLMAAVTGVAVVLARTAA
jgi:putative copper resistance protein D